jgi:glycine/D-amino acid oxidase-like deaminating enzyme
MTDKTTDILICGAGIAGVSTAYHLKLGGVNGRILLVDQGAPLSLTSDKSTECYRNFWPGPDPAMVQLMNRSIDILEKFAEDTNNIIGLNRRGYIFATAQSSRAEAYRKAGELAEEFGAGPLRVHDGSNHGSAYRPTLTDDFRQQPTGADLLTDFGLIKEHFPTLSDRVRALLHVRRAGWLSAQQLGMFMLREAQQAGVRVWNDRVEKIRGAGNRVQAVRLAGAGWIETGIFVNAAGPYIQEIGRMMDIELPVFTELHIKASFHDNLGILPRQAPLMIWGDRQYLDWSEEERQLLGESRDDRWLLEEFPAGAHTRPDGGEDSDIVLLLWEYNSEKCAPEFPIASDPIYPEIALRGICNMLPGMQTYLERLPKPSLDGGYYTKTLENRPLACPLQVEGAYLIGALSGFGIMASPGLGELLSACILDEEVPDYAWAFDLKRYTNPVYQEALLNWGDSWQI